MSRLSPMVWLLGLQRWLLLWSLLRELALAGARITSTKSLQCTEWTVPSARQKPNSQPLAALKSAPGMGDIFPSPENQDLQLQKRSANFGRANWQEITLLVAKVQTQMALEQFDISQPRRSARQTWLLQRTHKTKTVYGQKYFLKENINMILSNLRPSEGQDWLKNCCSICKSHLRKAALPLFNLSQTGRNGEVMSLHPWVR